MPEAIEKQIKKAVSILKEGGIVAYPTDTVYGLGASMSDITAVERIFKVKGRPKGMALPVLLANHEQIKQIVTFVPMSAKRLIEKFFPGALTIVLPKSDAVPDIITGGGKTVAFRIPDHPVPLALVTGLGKPIVGTSANLSGKPSPMTAAEVLEQIGDQIDMVIDGGKTPGGIESTVVDLSGGSPIIRRQGAISIDELRKILPDIKPAKEDSMRIAIGSDHRGLTLKKRVIDLLIEAGHEYKDFGAYTEDRVDYPEIAEKVGKAVISGDFKRGILICGTGIGMSMAANKIKGIRAALAFNEFTACRARQHNDANILCLGAEHDQSQLKEMVNAFLTCEFEGGRHQERVEMLGKMEKGC